jgi:uncharacterized protein YndB with AHSA1/START domain
MSSTPATQPGRPRRLKKRVLIPVVLLGLLLLLFAWLFVRGTWADSTARNPHSAAEGPVVQLLTGEPGRKEVRCALIVDRPPAEVWAVLTDYPHFADFFRYVSRIEVKSRTDQEVHLEGLAHSRLWGDWPFEVKVHHQTWPDKGAYVASWDDPDEELPVNRGSWVLEPAGGGRDKTLIVYTLQIETRHYPAFLVRNVLLDRIARIVVSARDEVQRRASS